MIRVWRHTFLSNRFFLGLGGVVVLFIVGFWVSLFFVVAQLALIGLAATAIGEGLILFHPRLKLSGSRHLPRLISLGHTHTITLIVANRFGMPLRLRLLEELPEQFQERHFELRTTITAGGVQRLRYPLRATERGAYEFGHVQCFTTTTVGLVQRRITLAEPEAVPVYPSVIEMKQFELKAMQRLSYLSGIKKLRRLGHSYEFEQIKNYVPGDDYRSINWKATSRKASLMVNQYEDERSQQVYAIIDKSRAMHMPFHGMSLLDYAINTSLVITNIALLKHDRAGLITFSNKVDTTIKADSKRHQIKKLLEALYREVPGQEEANYEQLYKATQQVVTGRSMLLLFTNFESFYAMERVLPLLRRLSHRHLLLVILFENAEVIDYGYKRATTLEEIYHQTIAQKFVTEKYQMIQTLQQFGIQTILTKPEDLSVNTVNKYLELKAKGMI